MANSKLRIALFIITLLPQLLLAQAVYWTRQIGNALPQRGYSIATDQEGNVYTMGHFNYVPLDFDPGPGEFILSAHGPNDVFVQKMDRGGNLLWVKNVGGVTATTGSQLTVDLEGNPIVAGVFTRSVDFDPGPDTFSLEPVSHVSPNAFVFKLDKDGGFLWAKQFTTTSYVGANYITSGPDGALYVAGSFSGTADFDPGANTASLSAVSNTDGYIMKLNADGEFNWVRHIAGDSINITALALDQDGGLFSTGGYDGSVDFDPGPGSSTLTAGGLLTDAFILKLDTDGNFIWAKSIGGPSREIARDIKADASGNVILGGEFYKNCDFDPGPGTQILSPIALSGSAMFLEKLDADGNFVWVKPFEKVVQFAGLDLDRSGNIYATGYFGGTPDFDPGLDTFLIGQNVLPGNTPNVFTLKLDFSGNFVWAKYLACEESLSADIAVDDEGFVYTTGHFTGLADMDPTEDIPDINSVGFSIDIFIQKISQDYDFSGSVFFDTNLNGLRDTGEIGLRNVIIGDAAKNLYATTNSVGKYRFFDNLVGDTLRPAFHWDNWVAVPSFAVPDTVQQIIDFAAFGPAVRDVRISMVEKSVFRPGFPTEILILAQNVGMVALDSVPVKLKLVTPSDPLLEFISSDPLPVAQSDDVFRWITGPIGVNETVEIHVFLKTPVSVTNGTGVTLSVYSSLQNDAYYSNNGDRVSTTVVGSFDPNDKQVSPAIVAPLAVDTSSLRYMIRFQNTGTYPADFVIIKDTLSADLDLSTLEVIAASHPYTWRMYGTRVLEFRFDNINLPDSTANEPESHGFVAFRVQPKDGLPLGKTIQNRAGIYFDYNEPVITNTAVMEVAIVSNVAAPAEQPWLDFGLSPNPVAAYSPITIMLPEVQTDPISVTIYDAQGKKLREMTVPAKERSVQVSGLAAGSYFVHLRAGKGVGGKGLLVR